MRHLFFTLVFLFVTSSVWSQVDFQPTRITLQVSNAPNKALANVIKEY
jgi:hypothetical protein